MIINTIYGLDLKASLFACNSCGYAFQTSTQVKFHVKNTEVCKSFQKHHTQKFQSTSNWCYFVVKLPNKPEHVEDPLNPVAYLKAKFAPIPFSQMPIMCMDTHNANNFLRYEKWDNLVKGKTRAQIK